jgi:hypothetical protein
MKGVCDIRPLEAKDHQARRPLWSGYQSFYRVRIPDVVSSVTWSRLLNPAEPMSSALAWSEDARSAWSTSSDIARAGRLATIAICRISSSPRLCADLASAAS